MSKADLNPDLFTAALWGLEAQKAKLESQIAEFKRILDTRARQPAVPAAPKPKPTISAAARKRMADAAKEQWADFHLRKAEAEKKAMEPTVAKKTAPKKAAKPPAQKIAAKGKKKAAARPPVVAEMAPEQAGPGS